MSKSTRTLALIITLSASFAIGAVHAAGTSDSHVKVACMRAYALVSAYRAEVRKYEALPGMAGLYAGLGSFVERFDTIDYEERARHVQNLLDPLAPEYEADPMEASANDVSMLITESTSAWLAVVGTPTPIFEAQRALFEKVRACDLTYAFDPPLGEVPSQEEGRQLLREKLNARAAERNR